MLEQDECLIDLVHSYPCLYDVKDTDFKVAIKKENAWIAIAMDMEKTDEFIRRMIMPAIGHPSYDTNILLPFITS